MKIKSEVIEGDMKRRSKKAYAKEIFILIFMLTAMILAQGCSNDNAKHVEALEGYTQIDEKPAEEADLVDIDGYFAGEGTINNIRHIRFQVKRDNEISNTIDVTSRFYSIDYTDAAEVKDTASAFMNGKVKAYVRTYKKDKDIKTHYYYVLYINRDKLKDCGELE